MSSRKCRECGTTFQPKQHNAAFCGSPCRRTWNNRRAMRGAQMYDAVMALRYDRKRAADQGVDWTFICRMAEMFNAADIRDGVSRSFRTVTEIKEDLGTMVNARVGRL